MPRIDEIPWHTLHHAYGTCDEFPNVVRWLASANPKERSHARHWLGELLFHQGTHYPANEFAVPFLIEAAAAPTLPERSRHFEFLSRFLFERKPPLSPTQRAERNRKLQKQLGYDFGGSSELWRDERRRTVAAAWTCRASFATMLQTDPDIAARCWAAFALASLALIGRRDGGGWTNEAPTPWFTPAAGAEILALLRSVASADANVAVRVSATFGLGYLRDEPGACEAVQALFANGDEFVRLAAAAAWHVATPTVPPDVTACVVEGIVKNRLRGQGSGYDVGYDPDHPLAAAYANLGMALAEPDANTPSKQASAFAFVPFPPLAAWLNASLDGRIPVATLVRRTLKSATTTERSRAIRFLGSVKLPQPEIGTLLQRWCRHTNPSVRMAASIALRRRERKTPTAAIIEAFREPLQSTNARLRRRAVQGLLSMWKFGPGGPIPAALPWVASAAEHETDPRVQKLMCQFFERAAVEDSTANDAYHQAQRVIVRWLREPVVCRAALAALRDLHSRPLHADALEPLLALLQSDDPARQYVPGRLARIASNSVLPVFIAALAKETDPEVRRAIGWALQQLPKPSNVVNAVLQAIRDGTLVVDGAVAQPLVLVARNVARSSAEQVQREVAAVVLEALRSSTTSADSGALAEAVGWLTVEPEQVADTLLQLALTAPEARARADAANALLCTKMPANVLLPRAIQIADRGDDAAHEGLLRLLDHGNTPELPGLARSLLPLLEHPNHERRKKVIKALRRMAANDRDVERAVLGKLADEHSDVRDEAAQYDFKKLPNKEVVPVLLKALDGPAPCAFAWLSLRGFSYYREAHARASLAELLPVAGQQLRRNHEMLVTDICEWLKEQGPTAIAIVPDLIALPDDPSPYGRFMKIETLFAIDPSQTTVARQALEPLLTHELDAVRKHAAELLDQLGA